MSALVVVDQDFRAASPTTRAPPTRFALNLTERCNLRCAHCITDAPRRTQEGTARVMTRPVLDALAPHLAHATHVSFTHAGEPITAPLFDDVLTALSAARASAPTSVHLLTNGLAMTPQRFTDAARRGVTSMSFSLDGMSAATNDVLRIGARVDVLLPRIAELARLRTAQGLDVRLGISTVVTRANVGELEALVRFAAGAGLSWVKLEELYLDEHRAWPDAVRGLAVDPRALDHAAQRARALAQELGLTVVDHTRDLPVWRCQLDLDPRMGRFARADDLANRAELSPCRLPWEQVCVEPDGDVRPLSFHHPVAGNLLVTDLGALFNAGPFQAARAAIRARRPCGEGPTTCAPDPGPSSW